MKVPPGIDALVQAVPSSIPPDMFQDAAPRARPVVPRPPPPSSRSTRVAKPASLPKLPAVKPLAISEIAVATPVTPEQTRLMPSSFPAMEKTLLLEVAPPPPPPPPPMPPPSSLGGMVAETPGATNHMPADAPPAPPEPAALDHEDLGDLVPAGVPQRRGSTARVLGAAGFAVLLTVAIVEGGALVRALQPIAKHPPTNAARPKAPEPTMVVVAPAASEPEVSATDEPVTPPQLAAPPPTSRAANAARGETGMINTAGATPGRRIFVDHKTVGQTPDAVLVTCGVRKVRVGSAGKMVSIEVPCGGAVSVSDR